MTKKDRSTDSNIEEEVQSRLKRRLQLLHDQHVWERLRTDVSGWQRGSYHNHEVNRVAEGLGLKVTPPAFLDRILEVLDEVKPEADTRNENKVKP